MSIPDRLSEKNEILPTENPSLPPAAIGITDEPDSPVLPTMDPAERPPADIPPQQDPAAPKAPPEKPPAAKPMRDRSVYFIRVDADGAILRSPVTRPVAISSPLADAMRILIQGPTAEEKRRGLRTLIPGGAKFLSADIRGSTAYISFSDEFKFNDYGVEGYVGQLQQIVWTATEFPNITDVQILIDGRIVEYLGERIKIGSPRDRNSF